MTELSIIVPVYNVEPFLRECLESLLRQGSRSFEVVLINDGSTDGGAGICQEYARRDPRFRFVDKQNEGLSLTRNLGLSIAEGEHVLFLDSDDYLTDGAVDRLLEYAEKNDLDAVGLGIRRFFEDGDQDVPFPPRLAPGEVASGCGYLNAAIRGGGYNTMAQSMMVRRSILLGNGIRFEPGIYHEDILYTITMLLHAPRVGCAPGDHYLYRIRQGSMTSDTRHYPIRIRSLEFVVGKLAELQSKFTTPEERFAVQYRIHGALSILVDLETRQGSVNLAGLLRLWRNAADFRQRRKTLRLAWNAIISRKRTMR